ncbi:MAG TPA: S24 family peptidase [Terriglobales bacterium]|nr:S24 family peptidase [Terriglobales bacterium]
MRAGTKLARPEWAVQIERLRERLHLNQAGLARLLNVSPMAVSRWERAVNEPEAAFYIHMGTLSGDPDCWYFWQRAGLPASDLKRALRKSRSPRTTHAAAEAVETHSVALLGVTAGTSGPGDNDPNLEQIPEVAKLMAPKDWSEHYDQVRCLRVSGDGMAPLIANGSIVAVDLSPLERSQLNNAIVLAWHKDHGLMVRRLKRTTGVELLVAESDRHPATAIPFDLNWRVLGRVIWWMSKPR